jgi:hypothetical protein
MAIEDNKLTGYISINDFTNKVFSIIRITSNLTVDKFTNLDQFTIELIVEKENTIFESKFQNTEILLFYELGSRFLRYDLEQKAFKSL